MEYSQYKRLVKEIPFGKELPNAKYLLRCEDLSFGNDLDSLVQRVLLAFKIEDRFNIIKFRTDEFKVSFLAYPDFHESPHPALQEAITVDLTLNKIRRQCYRKNQNPPILHRKEHFLPSDHADRDSYSKLTLEEERVGLFESPKTIGFKLNWENLLKKKGIRLEGHRLLQDHSVNDQNNQSIHRKPRVDRHKTAMTRYDLSKPIKSLLEYNLIKPVTRIFDYGCGQGSDVRGLQSLGYQVAGWDPVFAHDQPKKVADVVNLGFVINVIEDPMERVETLLDAYHHTEKLLVVSALIQETVDSTVAIPFRDGVLTKRNTFQKFYEQSELQHYIEDALEVTAIPVALGVFYIFRAPEDQQDFLQSRTKRTINWNQISSRLGLGRPEPRSRKERPSLYQLHADILDPFWKTLLELGRQPTEEEFPQLQELRKRLRSANRAERLFLQRGGEEELTVAKERRKGDLMVYMAMSNFRKRVPFKHLSKGLKQDIKSFIGDYKRGLEQGMDLLFAVGDPDEIEIACEEVKIGHQDKQALYVHRMQLDGLPPLLRIYVSCASQLYGDVNQADIIKIHKASGKVTFLLYDDFEGKHLPELQQRIKVDLPRQFVNVFDHSDSGQLLYFKERFMIPSDPSYEKQVKYGTKLKPLDVGIDVGFGPSKKEFLDMLAERGLNENLNKKRKC